MWSFVFGVLAGAVGAWTYHNFIAFGDDDCEEDDIFGLTAAARDHSQDSMREPPPHS